MKSAADRNIKQLQNRLSKLELKLKEANETIDAIRTGQVDALMIQDTSGHQVYTLKTADLSYRIFIEKMAEGAATVSRDGTILYCNSQFALLVGHTLNDVIGRSFADFIEKSEVKTDVAALLKNNTAQDTKLEIELKNDGHLTPVQISLTPLEMEAGILVTIIIITDLSQQKKIQAQLTEKNNQLAQINSMLEASNADLQQFASVASHDLQEPLRKIRFYSDALTTRENHITAPQASEFLQKIVLSAARMQKLIIDILNYSLVSGRGLNTIAAVDLNVIVRELVDDLELSLDEKKAQVNVSALTTVKGNQGQLRQVFQNIISNALKFARKDITPVIDISGSRIHEKSFYAGNDDHGKFCRIIVKDNGIGFDEKYVEKIFTLFERLNSKDQYEGTGIGLAVTKRIIERHNGLITAAGTPGAGAEFIIILPVYLN